MTTTPLLCKQAYQIDLVDYLGTLGFLPKKIRMHDYWYQSPLRVERTPSFKVNRRLNVWYDNGLGKGDNLPRTVRHEKRLLLFPEHNAREYYSVILNWLFFIIVATYFYWLARFSLESFTT